MELLSAYLRTRAHVLTWVKTTQWKKGREGLLLIDSHSTMSSVNIQQTFAVVCPSMKVLIASAVLLLGRACAQSGRERTIFDSEELSPDGLADDSPGGPHYHRGKLTPFEIGPPAILLSHSDESRLRAGKPVMQAVETGNALSKRMLMVQDIAAPPHIVMNRIMDLQNYGRMVDGVNSVVNYESDKGADGLEVVKSTYDISALHLRFNYHVTHVYDPAQRCMVFRLDYDKKSDIDDSVGYWYVQPRGFDKSRVFYSCECKLRGWVPPPVVNVLTKEALKKATTWVSRESVNEWRSQRSAMPGPDALVRFVCEAREKIDSFKPPPFVESFLHSRQLHPKRALVRFVSAARPPQKARLPL